MDNKVKIILGILLVSSGYFVSQSFLMDDRTSNTTQSSKVQKQEANNHLEQKEDTSSSLLPKDKKQPENIIKSSSKEVISMLKLDLYGVFPSNKSGYALIAYNGAPQQVYLVSASLSEGVFLKKLLEDAVIIDNHGKLETFYLKKQKKADHNVSVKKQEQPPITSLEPPTYETPPPFDINNVMAPPPSFPTESLPPSPNYNMDGNGPWTEN